MWLAPRPPYSCGQPSVSQPFAASFFWKCAQEVPAGVAALAEAAGAFALGPVGGEFRLEEGADLLAERFLFGGETELHDWSLLAERRKYTTGASVGESVLVAPGGGGAAACRLRRTRLLGSRRATFEERQQCRPSSTSTATAPRPGPRRRRTDAVRR